MLVFAVVVVVVVDVAEVVVDVVVVVVAVFILSYFNCSCYDFHRCFYYLYF